MSSTGQGGIRSRLQDAARQCDNRGLMKASQWASEQLMGMQDPSSNGFDDVEDFFYGSELFPQLADGFLLYPSKENDILMFARSLIIAGEYQRCAFFLRKRRYSATNPQVISSLRAGMAESAKSSSTLKSQQVRMGLFLANYSEYMAGEKVKEQDISEAAGKEAAAAAGPGAAGKKPDPRAATSGGGAADAQGQSHVGGSLAAIAETERVFSAKNSHLLDLCYRELVPLYKLGLIQSDGFLLYLFAVIARDVKRQEGAPVETILAHMQNLLDKQSDTGNNPDQSGGGPEVAGVAVGVPSVLQLFIESLRVYPWNWSCWLELADLCVAEKLPLPQWAEFNLQSSDRAAPVRNGIGGMNFSPTGTSTEAHAETGSKIMYACFLVHVYLERHCGEQALQVAHTLLPLMPYSLPLYTQVGLAQYCLRRYDEAEGSFELLREQDPYRLQSLDTYSNILYVKEKQAELSHLAHSVVKVEKFCPESCCVVGNYYSLKGQHERAVLYFQV